MMPSLFEINRGQALDDVRWLTEKRGPEFVFAQRCEYASPVVDEHHVVQGYRPCCAVGQMLHRHGVDPDTLKAMDSVEDPDEHEDQDTQIIRPYVLKVLRGRAGVTLSPGALGVYWAFQNSQDAGTKYGECLAEAEAAGPIEVDVDPV